MITEDIREKLKKIVIIVPSLNPDDKLMQVVNGMIEIGFSNILLINDGSDAKYSSPFEEASKYPECTVLTHEINMGKGRALKTAFSYILENHLDIIGVITADGDNQHTPNDAVKLALGLINNPNIVMMGVRDFKKNHVPLH